MEIRKGFFKSKIYNKSILLIEPGNDIHNDGFIGLNYGDGDYITRLNINDTLNLEPNSYFDYCFIHGFLLREIHNKSNFNLLESLNIQCDKLVIDYMGEGYSIISDFQFSSSKNLNKICSFKKIKVLSPIDNIDVVEREFPNIEFFSTNIPGLRAFAHPFNQMLHESNVENIPSDFDHHEGRYVYAGLKWSSHSKNNLYSCLNNRESYHRVFIVNELLNSDVLNQGIVSCNFGENFNKEYDVYDYKDSYVKKKNISLKKLSIDENISSYFGPNIHISKNCYIDVVTETSPDELMFITEKCVKPFLNLQFPIVYGPPGIITKLKEYGFDMFDDIINHNYDYVSSGFKETDENIKQSKLNSFNLNKSKLIVKELERLSKLDFHQIYLDSKDRLLYNQKLAHTICFENNPILFDIGKFLFEDSIFYCYDGTYIEHYF